DSTNIITPDLSVITNISFDHMQFLGNTLADIAREKAGIIKPCIPVVIGESEGEVKQIFSNTADNRNADIHFADIENDITESTLSDSGQWTFESVRYPNLKGELGGYCQEKNAATVLTAVSLLKQSGYNIPANAVYEGFAHVVEITGLQGRWQKTSVSPLTICDTGHNTGGMQYIVRQLKQTACKQLRIIIGMVNDKDVSGVLKMLPREAIYYFTQASVKRALPAQEIQQIAAIHGLKGDYFPSVGTAYCQAVSDSDKEDFIFVGGSTFIVADF
ncbi:MAG: bifunctional folylpolyglutamate synthase/dihydrofolate synthase, partial [Bacteroidaceae bacterium]|nr:bifunctional folylpolyglutamate synthase/dihydrofolate synthase [Bacteroidaceae bacterium]